VLFQPHNEWKDSVRFECDQLIFQPSNAKQAGYLQKKEGIFPLVAARSGKLSRAALHSDCEASTPSGFLGMIEGIVEMKWAAASTTAKSKEVRTEATV
jgi:hypothetical protein